MKTCSGPQIGAIKQDDPKHTAHSQYKHTANTTQESHNFLNVIEWPSQSPDLNLIEHLWRDLKIAVQRQSLSKLIELERICREEWEKLPKYRRDKLVASYPRSLEAVIAAQGASAKY